LLSRRFGHIFDKPLAPIAKYIPLSPNAISMAGLIITAVAAVIIPIDLLAGGVLVAIGGLFDILDGFVARATGKRTSFGAFLDSTLDRYSDSLLILGTSWYFYDAGNIVGVALSACALVGALITSYTRARAEGLGIDCNVGILERPERVVIIAFGCITGLVLPAIIVICVLGHITVIQRIAHVYGRLRNNP
jgi:phosphatidylglycerophosphate synthase